METIPFFNLVNGAIMWGTLALQIASLVLLLSFLRIGVLSRIQPFVSGYGLPLAFIVSLAAVLGSMYYSEVAGFQACVLCWYQRAFIFPQVVLFALALWRSDRSVFPYAMTLSVVTAVLAAYHVALQSSVALSGFCDPTDALGSCVEKFVEGFGFITIPVMSLSYAVFVLLVGMVVRQNDALQGE